MIEFDDSACPVCGSTGFQVMGRLRNDLALRCPGCRLEVTGSVLKNRRSELGVNGQAGSIMTSPDYREAMITQYDAFRDRIKERASSRLGLYSELLGGRPGSILEVGSGTGWMIGAFQELGVSGTGLEIDETLVSLARKEGADVRLADVCRIDPRDHVKYDVVCSSQTLEHLSDPRPAIRNMRDMARKGGLIHLDVPNSASWGARYHRFRRGKKRWGMLEPPHHQMGYYPATLRRLLEEAGLEILRVVEKPTDDEVFGQAILPTAFLPKAAIRLSRWLGHGYLLVGLARVS